MIRGEIGEKDALADDIYMVNIGQIILAFDRDMVDVETRNYYLTQIWLRTSGTMGYASNTRLQQRGNGCQINIPADVAESAGYTTAISDVTIRSPNDEGLFVIYPTAEEVDATFIDELLNE